MNIPNLLRLIKKFHGGTSLGLAGNPDGASRRCQAQAPQVGNVHNVW
jgi:5,10-methylenetetrahydrofolate reductase